MSLWRGQWQLSSEMERLLGEKAHEGIGALAHNYPRRANFFQKIMKDLFFLALRGYLWVKLSSHHRMVGMMEELNWYSCPGKSHMMSQMFRISKSITLTYY